MKETAMHSQHRAGRSLLRGAAVVSALFAFSGCELLVDFDRSKIPDDSGTISFEASPGSEAGSGDGGDATVASDASDGGAPVADATATDADAATPATDGASEGAAPDGSVDGSSLTEAGEAGVDTGAVDTGVDAPASDASDAATE
jgi:hypothetical protein